MHFPHGGGVYPLIRISGPFSCACSHVVRLKFSTALVELMREQTALRANGLLLSS